MKKEGEQIALQSLGGRFAWMFSNHGVHEGLGVGNILPRNYHLYQQLPANMDN